MCIYTIIILKASSYFIGLSLFPEITPSLSHINRLFDTHAISCLCHALFFNLSDMAHNKMLTSIYVSCILPNSGLSLILVMNISSQLDMNLNISKPPFMFILKHELQPHFFIAYPVCDKLSHLKEWTESNGDQNCYLYPEGR